MDGNNQNPKHGTVLFVDDERRVLTSMRAMFRRDYDVLLANSGQEALDLLREYDVDVIVSDQRMPGMTGVDMLKQVKTLAPRAMRILLTGYADLKAIEASINEGEVFRFLTKPCAPEQLREAIEHAIEASAVDASAVEASAVETSGVDAWDVEASLEEAWPGESSGTGPLTADSEAPEPAVPDSVARSGDIDFGLGLESTVEVVSPEDSTTSSVLASDAFELIEVVPKGGTATTPPAGLQPLPRRTPTPPTAGHEVSVGPRSTVNLLVSDRRAVAAGPMQTPESPEVAVAPSTPRSPVMHRPHRPVRTPAARRPPPATKSIGDVDLLVLTQDTAMVGLIEGALDGRHRLHAASDVDGALALLEAHPIGVLVTDLVVREDEIAELTTQLKQHVPELVTIVASERSDAQQLIDLINYGQIFRFLLKPLHGGQCRLSIDSAIGRHRELALDPSLARRHVVAARPKPIGEGVMRHVIARVRRLRERFSAANGVA